VTHAKGYGKLINGNDCRIAAPLLEAANVLLAKSREIGKLLLRQALFLPEPLNVPADQSAHVHAQEVTGLHTLGLSTIICRHIAIAGFESSCMDSRTTIKQYRRLAEGLLGRVIEAPKSFKASGDFAPTFVSDNIERLLGYKPSEYLENPDFRRDRVHPDELSRVEAEIARLFRNGFHVLEYRFRRKDGSYCWVNDEQHLIRCENGVPLEIVGSWSDVTARKTAEEAKAAAHARLSQLLTVAPAVIYSFKASGD
jgi:PAS domain S-box-containing protein